MIRTASLSFTYAGSEGPALAGVDLTIGAGERVALIGGSGAGKTTLLRILAGFSASYLRGRLEGEVEVGGADPARLRPEERCRRVGYLFSDPRAQLSGTCFSVREEVAWGLGNLAVPRPEMEERVEAVLHRLGLAPLARRSPFALSGGEQQRLALASLLALAPAVLLLDEPVAMLDPAGIREVQEAVSAAGHSTVVWATPRLEEVVGMDRWLVLSRGRLIYDGPPAVLEPGEALEAPWTRLARRAAEQGLWRGDPPVREEECLEGLARNREEE